MIASKTKKLFNYFKNSKINILSQDFEKVLQKAKKGDFVYLDPPYDQIKNKNSFISYTNEIFDRDQQERLFQTFEKLSAKGAQVMLSNHNTEFINQLYKNTIFMLYKAKRMINSKGTGRGFIEEVVITNY
ncbi:DNA adenine methylase [Mycoplasmopsis citelli]|nr:DNA adenine methylase [Mycoplasmopsis citelli]